MVLSPFDRFIEGALIGARIKPLNPGPLDRVVPTRSEPTVFGRFDSNIRIFYQATIELCRSRAVDTLINASITYVPSMGDVPIGVDFATIIVCDISQKIRPAKAHEKEE
jgi:hypothetical protein